MALSVYMRDDFRWIAPDYKCWVGKNPMFDVLNGETRISLSQPGMFADCEDPAEIEAYDNMPDPEHIDLDRLEALLDEAHANGMATASGMWSCFFHVVADFFGMENYQKRPNFLTLNFITYSHKSQGNFVGFGRIK